jgi:hypothetical protein
MLTRLSLALLALALLFGGSAQAANILLGETVRLGAADGGNANLLMSSGPYGLTTPATIKSLSFYVTTASGHLRLGIYDRGPNNNCAGGALKAQTNSFTPGSNKWNTANVVTQAQLPAGNYCLVALPSSNSLGFVKGMTTGIHDYCASFTFGPMPATFPANPGCMDGFHWSLYATLAPVAMPTLSLSFNPPNPIVPANAPAGSVVATVLASWSNGNPFTGTLAFGTPYFSDGGIFAIDGNSNLIISSTGPGLSGDGGTIQNITTIATQ